MMRMPRLVWFVSCMCVSALRPTSVCLLDEIKKLSSAVDIGTAVFVIVFFILFYCHIYTRECSLPLHPCVCLLYMYTHFRSSVRHLCDIYIFFLFFYSTVHSFIVGLCERYIYIYIYKERGGAALVSQLLGLRCVVFAVVCFRVGVCSEHSERWLLLLLLLSENSPVT